MPNGTRPSLSGPPAAVLRGTAPQPFHVAPSNTVPNDDPAWHAVVLSTPDVATLAEVAPVLEAPAPVPAERRDWVWGASGVVRVADFSYLLTREGWTSASFLQDAFLRRILGFVVATTETTQLVSRTRLQAVDARQWSSATCIADSVTLHSCAGSQGISLAFIDNLLELGMAPSIGRVGTAFDNALFESTIGLCRTELLRRRGHGWGGRVDLELATTRAMVWFNTSRLQGHLGYRTPFEIETAYVEQQGLPRQAA